MYNSVVFHVYVSCSWDGLLEGRNCSCVWTFWCSDLCSLDQTVTVQRGSVLDVRGPEGFLGTVEYNSWRVGRVVPMIRSVVRTTLHCLLRLDVVAELNQTDTWRAEDGFNDGRVELYQQLLWQVELSQLAKEVQPRLGLFHHGLNVIVPLQVLRNCGAQESEWLHCSHRAVHDGEWGRAGGGGGVLLKSTIISTVLRVLSARLLRLHQGAP